ncbi:MAG TPA: hypothetical protein VL068_07515, partial [Microthrixaceae bacterium]|nr:hypothetical protein [Microthrixaceae bacterium]
EAGDSDSPTDIVPADFTAVAAPAGASLPKQRVDALVNVSPETLWPAQPNPHDGLDIDLRP